MRGWESFSPLTHTFFSHRLSLTERNHDIGNRELLAVKLSLEEWHWWGAKEPLLIWTDHKSLEYIRSAKRLNSSSPAVNILHLVQLLLLLLTWLL